MLSRIALGRTRQSWTALLTIATWFCLSNHCALGLGVIRAEPAPSAEVTGCPMHSAPTKKKPAAKIPCCKEVRAVVGKCAVDATTFALRLVSRHDYGAQIFLPPPRVSIKIEGLDTGPPGPFSFAELVLQKSMRAHAPPLS
jgi:hypothetical protein